MGDLDGAAIGLAVIALLAAFVVPFAVMRSPGATTTHSHNLVTGIWTATNGTQNCTSSTTAFVLCSDLAPSQWFCSGNNMGCAYSMNINVTQGFPDTLYCIATFLYSFSAAVADTATIAMYDLSNNVLVAFIQPTQTSLGVATEKYSGALSGQTSMFTAGPTTQGDLMAIRIHQSVSVGVTLTVNMANFQCYDMNIGGVTGLPVG